MSFDAAWDRRDVSRYGRATVSWINLDDLITVKSEIDDPLHQEDARGLRVGRQKRQDLDET